MFHKLRNVPYGWWVAVTGMANMIFTSGPTFQGASALFLAVEAEFGWSRALIGGVASFGQFGAIFFGPIVGSLTDRLGPARMMLAGLTLGGLGFIFLSRVHGVATYYAAYLLLSLGFSFGGFVPSIVAVNAWLPGRRSTGIALVVGGSSLGGIVVPALAWGISEVGWRTTTLWIGIVAILIAPVFHRILSRRLPAEPARQEEGRPAPERRSVSFGRPGRTDFTAREALRTRAFWIISFTHSLVNFSTAAVSAHVLLHFDDVGINPIKAATIIPVMATASLVSQMAGGVVGDRFEKRFPISMFAAIQGTAVLILAFTTSYATALVFAVVWGIGFGGRTPILHALRGEYFGSKAFGTILGLSSVIMGVSMAVAPFVVGLLFDLQETYRYAFIGMAVAAYAAAALILFVARPVHPSQRAREGPATAGAAVR